MSIASQIRGMLLEEALLYLLRVSGYRTVDDVTNDDTLLRAAAGIRIKGRGCNHQIDAIADFTITPPFTHPQRLLVEAKCIKPKVRVDVIRNALGVLMDVEEYWIPKGHNVPMKLRYHYQYAVFSASGYTSEAERYAFAHDIYLIPLGKSRYFQTIIASIMTVQDRGELTRTFRNVPGSLYNLRMAVRQALQEQNRNMIENLDLGRNLRESLTRFIQQCQSIDGAVLAVLNKRFPVFMVPNPEIRLNDFINRRRIEVRIFWDNRGWYIRSAENGTDLFSFDLPEEMLQLYIEGGILSASRALDLKEQFLSEIELILTLDNLPYFVTLNLDREWISQLRTRARRRN